MKHPQTHPLQDDATGSAAKVAPSSQGRIDSALHDAACAAKGPGPAVGKETRLTAQSLLAGRTWVGIEHNGQHYRLQTTRAGKLILTK